MLLLYNLFNIKLDRHVPLTYALFLLLLSVSGNYIGQTLSCQIQKFFKNMIVKQLVTLFIIYFTIVFTKEGDNNVPTDDMIDAIKIWIGYLLFSKMDLLPSLFVILLLMLTFILDNFRKYYENNLINNEKITKIKEIQKTLLNVIILVVILGSTKYFIGKKREFKSLFSFKKFIFGVKKCRNL